MRKLREFVKVERWFLAMLALGVVPWLPACSEADMASRNISKEADRFQVDRRIVFYNSITDTYMLTIEGLCSLGNQDKAREVTVTCKTGRDEFRKHFLGLSDNVTFFAEHRAPTKVDVYHYKVIFRPQTLLPDIDLDIK